MSEPQCMEDYDFGEVALMCWLSPGHDGLHYDAAKNISWKEGMPDE